MASGLTCFITGLVYPKLKVDEGEFKGKDILRFNIYQIIANVISWVIVAPILDIVVYAEPANLVFTQGIVAAISNAISAGVIGTILLALYSKTRSKKGSLSKDQQKYKLKSENRPPASVPEKQGQVSGGFFY